MLRRVHPVLVLGTIALVGFLAGTRLEPMLDAAMGVAPARAMELPNGLKKQKPAAITAKVPVKPATLRGLPAPVQAVAAAPALVTVAPVAVAPVAAVPAAPPTTDAATATAEPEPAAAVPVEAEPTDITIVKPSVISGRDPNSDVEFYEMKDLPEAAGEGKGDATPGRDVDMIDDKGDAPLAGKTADAPTDQSMETAAEKPADQSMETKSP